MQLEAATTPVRRRRRPTAALAVVSAAIHLALLGPLALTTSRLDARRPPEMVVTVIPVEILRRPPAGSPARPPSGPAGELPEGGRAPAMRVPAPPVARTQAPPPAPVSTGSGGARAVDDAWRVRAGPGAPARLPCPAPAGDRLMQRVCAVGPTPDHDPPPLTRADLLPLDDGRSRDRREEGFARQVEANEAWRAYTRDGGAYPGLRSLFKER